MPHMPPEPAREGHTPPPSPAEKVDLTAQMPDTWLSKQERQIAALARLIRQLPLGRSYKIELTVLSESDPRGPFYPITDVMLTDLSATEEQPTEPMELPAR